MTVTVGVLQEHPLLVAGLGAVLAPHGDRVRVVRLDPSAPDLGAVDVVLHDLDDGRPTSSALLPPAAGGRRPRVLALAGTLTVEVVRGAMADGAHGVVARTASPDELVDAVERVHRGDRVAPGPRDHVEGFVTGRWPGDHDGLSERESQVLVLVCRGWGNREIAASMEVSKNTLKTYIRTAYDKIGVTTRSQAVLWGVEHGLARPDPG